MQGKRFFLSQHDIKKEAANVRPLTWLLQNDLPLLVEVPKGQQILQKGSQVPGGSESTSETSELAQLRRIWVATPSKPLCFAGHPKIVIGVCIFPSTRKSLGR